MIDPYLVLVVSRLYNGRAPFVDPAERKSVARVDDHQMTVNLRHFRAKSLEQCSTIHDKFVQYVQQEHPQVGILTYYDPHPVPGGWFNPPRNCLISAGHRAEHKIVQVKE